jgi:outer membrane protein assembly factor BamB
MIFNVNMTGFIRATAVICLSLSLFQCKFFNNEPPANTGEEPAYTLKIVWESDTERVEEPYTAMDGEAVYLFDGAALDSYLMGSVLVKLNAQTGESLWKTDMLNFPAFTSPAVTGTYVYVLIPPNAVFCFDKQDGSLAAKAFLDIDDQKLEIYRRSFTEYENFLYFGMGHDNKDNYFVRADTGHIQKDGGQTEQHIEPEIVWRPKNDRAIVTEPAFHNGVVYIHNVAIKQNGDPVELAGINMTTKAVEFYTEFGFWNNGEYYDNGWNFHSLYVQDDILYYIGSSISAYNLKTAARDQLYLKTFSPDTPHKEVYGSTSSLDVAFHNNKIYYTNEVSNYLGDDGYRIVLLLEKH